MPIPSRVDVVALEAPPMPTESLNAWGARPRLADTTAQVVTWMLHYLHIAFMAWGYFPPPSLLSPSLLPLVRRSWSQQVSMDMVGWTPSWSGAARRVWTAGPEPCPCSNQRSGC